MRCPHCRTPMDPGPRVLGALQGEHGALKLTLDRVPALTCPHGHHAPIDADFMFWLIQELKERVARYPVGEEKGFLMLKKHLCACGRELPAQPGPRKAYPERVSYEGKFEFDALFDFALHECPGCGKAQLRSAKEAQKDVSYSLVAITDAARFPHSG
jgi:hypothetical protein